MKRVSQSYGLVSSRVPTRQPDGPFYSFGPAVSEEGLPQSTRGYLRKFLSQICDRLDVVDIRAAVDQAIHLILRRPVHHLVSMTGVGYRDTREAIQELFSVGRDIGRTSCLF